MHMNDSAASSSRIRMVDESEGDAGYKTWGALSRVMLPPGPGVKLRFQIELELKIFR